MGNFDNELDDFLFCWLFHGLQTQKKKSRLIQDSIIVSGQYHYTRDDTTLRCECTVDPQ